MIGIAIQTMVLQLNLAAAKLQSLKYPDDCELNRPNAMIGSLLKTADLVINGPKVILKCRSNPSDRLLRG
jgi:hypothetical protein